VRPTILSSLTNTRWPLIVHSVDNDVIATLKRWPLMQRLRAIATKVRSELNYHQFPVS
jgi:hypothetical protein